MITRSEYRFIGRYEYEIIAPSKKWVINHNFGHSNISTLAYSGCCLLHPSWVEYTYEQVEVIFDTPTAGSLVIIDNIEQNLWNAICGIEAKRS